MTMKTTNLIVAYATVFIAFVALCFIYRKQPTKSIYQQESVAKVEQVSEWKQFTTNLNEMCVRQEIKYAYFTWIPYIETKFSPKSVNKIGASSLFQFTKSTRKSLGIPDDVHTLPPSVQVKYAEKYVIAFRQSFYKAEKSAHIGSLYLQYYLCWFHPRAVGKPPNYILPQNTYEGNKNIDLLYGNKDKKIQVWEVNNFVNAMIKEGMEKS